VLDAKPFRPTYQHLHGSGVGDSDGSGLGVALAGALLRDVDAAVDLIAVAAAGALVGCVASLLKALVDLLVVLVSAGKPGRRRWRRGPDSVCTSAHCTCGYRSSREPCSSRPRSVW
jgi:hypothetical protein